VPTYEKGTKGKYQVVAAEKSWDKLKQSLKTITRKTSPLSIAQRIHKLNEVCRGWLNYFRMASITGKLKTLIAGYATGYATAFGRIGRNPNVKGKTSCA
jgi:RNA-directed DNA polymerase